MLVVTRKKDEKLIIGNEIEIQVLRIGRDNVNAVQSQIPDKSAMETLKGVFRVETKDE
jgi:sRNA-binding carbon storage regulator CsrA